MRTAMLVSATALALALPVLSSSAMAQTVEAQNPPVVQPPKKIQPPPPKRVQSAPPSQANLPRAKPGAGTGTQRSLTPPVQDLVNKGQQQVKEAQPQKEIRVLGRPKHHWPEAQAKPIKALGKSRITGDNNPFAGQTNAQLQAQIDSANQAQKIADDAKRANKNPQVVQALEFQAKEKQAKAFQAQSELERRAAPPAPGPTPVGPTPVEPRPADPPGQLGDRPGPSFGYRPPAPGVAPIVVPQPQYVGPPRATAQPNARPPTANDDPVCIQGTWAVQDGQRKYVCLSWHFQGQIYTPDQLQIVLSQLGRPEPALMKR
jgi:hypothetical protein